MRGALPYIWGNDWGLCRAIARQNRAVSVYLEQEAVPTSVSLSETLQTWVREDRRLQVKLALPSPAR